MSGERGQQVINEYATIISDYDRIAWGNWRVEVRATGCDPRKEQFDTSLHCMCCMGITWRRLVLLFEDPKYRLLQVAKPGITKERVDQITDEIAELRVRCSKCVGNHFAPPWLQRLRSPETFQQAVGSIRLAVASSPLASLRTEMKHLDGEEVRRPGARGRAAAPQELSIRTYVKSVSKQNRKHSEAVFRKVLVKRSSFTKKIRSFISAKSRLKTPSRVVKRMMRRTRNQANEISAWGEYQRVHWTPGVRPGTAAAKAEKQKLWREFCCDDRQHYEGMAAERTRRALAVGHNMHEDLQNGPGTRYQGRQARGRGFLQTVKELEQDSSWSPDVSVAGPWLGIRPELVDFNMSMSEIQN